ncbi:auxin-induced in root cultures protein 12 isoform X1 [Prunus yedoensis var. nudiflora]|uniref:Auxin-induced in root cultures protein 12 isoform X1 n=1 Tax=Prunus yedoensis var. nudiflora TaxID=2094558 RepID=A0A314ZET7_PRUYE|nr:auxin-induced in root cultures protein 12 isoform X1 [Prunus yedoensis var. nudiflora]
MASSLLLLVSVSWFSSFLALLVSPAQAATCTSQAFNNNKLYSSCTDLPVLSSYLHWTYDTSNSSMSIAFVCTPSQSDGWVAWGINPTSTKMAGAQILLAYNTDSGIPTVKTFNISSYTSLVPGKLSFDIWDISSEFSNGTFKIFAAVKVPKNEKSVNQVWQVGPRVNQTSGFPDKHDIVGPNLESFQTLSLAANPTTLSLAANPTTGTTINPNKPGTSINKPYDRDCSKHPINKPYDHGNKATPPISKTSTNMVLCASASGGGGFHGGGSGGSGGGGGSGGSGGGGSGGGGGGGSGGGSAGGALRIGSGGNVVLFSVLLLVLAALIAF